LDHGDVRRGTPPTYRNAESVCQFHRAITPVFIPPSTGYAIDMQSKLKRTTPGGSARRGRMRSRELGAVMGDRTLGYSEGGVINLKHRRRAGGKASWAS
jgi:hypothetical protein